MAKSQTTYNDLFPNVNPASNIRCPDTNSRYTLYIPRNISLA
jgi:hypothetical protein